MTDDPPRGPGRPLIGPELRGVRLDIPALREVEKMALRQRVPRAVVIRDLVNESLAVRAEARKAKRRQSRP